MPNYTGPGRAQLLRNNSQGLLWSNEVVTPPQLSVSFLLERINRSYYPWGLSFEVSFAADPGAFEIDIMGANSDSSAQNYSYLGTITQTNHGYGSYGGFNGYVGRWDMPSNLWPRYVAGFVKTLTNAVAMTLTVTK